MAHSLRSFLIAFLLALVIFGVSGVYATKFIKDLMLDTLDPAGTNIDNTLNESDDGGQNKNNDTNNSDDDLLKDCSSFSVLFITPDASGQQADAILFMKADKENKRFVFSPIPVNVKVGDNSLDPSGMPVTLGSIYYTHGAPYLKQMVEGLIGMKIDYYIDISMEGVSSLVDLVGGVNYNVPYKMLYGLVTEETTATDPETGEETVIPALYEIDLAPGEQLLDGAHSIMLLRYRGYSNGDDGRRTMQLNFLKQLFKQTLTEENFSKAGDIFNSASEIMTTDCALSDFIKNANLLFMFGKFEISQTVKFPGTTQTTVVGNYIIPDSAIHATYKPYK